MFNTVHYGMYMAHPIMHCKDSEDSGNVVLFAMILFIKGQGCASLYNEVFNYRLFSCDIIIFTKVIIEN